jgi:hypothetical protein
MSEVCRLQRRYADAQRHALDGISMFETLNSTLGVAVQHLHLAHILLTHGDIAQAATRTRRCLLASHRHHFEPLLSRAVACVGALLLARDDATKAFPAGQPDALDRAAVCLLAAAPELFKPNADLIPELQAEVRQSLDQARARVMATSATHLAELEALAASLTSDQRSGYALDALLALEDSVA